MKETLGKKPSSNNPGSGQTAHPPSTHPEKDDSVPPKRFTAQEKAMEESHRQYVIIQHKEACICEADTYY